MELHEHALYRDGTHHCIMVETYTDVQADEDTGTQERISMQRTWEMHTDTLAPTDTANRSRHPGAHTFCRHTHVRKCTHVSLQPRIPDTRARADMLIGEVPMDA